MAINKFRRICYVGSFELIRVEEINYLYRSSGMGTIVISTLRL